MQTAKMIVVASALVASVSGPGPAGATFPGEEGNIVMTNGDEIYTVTPKGDAQEVVPQDEVEDRGRLMPTWSPDSERIAFVRSDENYDYNIYVMNADGSDVVQVTDHSGYNWSPSWAPDGDRLVFTSDRRGSSQMYIKSVDGDEIHRLRTDFSVIEPSWSPDGRWIAFTAYSRSWKKNAIYKIKPNGKGLTKLSDVYGEETGAAWSPDSKRIGFIGYNKRGSTSPYVVRRDGTHQRRVRLSCRTDCYANDVAWSPEGDRLGVLVLFYESSGHRIWAVTLGEGDEEIYSASDISSLDWGALP